jgi:hypothetical protein
MSTRRYVTLAFPIQTSEFNDILEDHISRGLVPTTFHGVHNPLDDDIWMMVHDWPLVDQHRTFAAITYPGTDFALLT